MSVMDHELAAELRKLAAHPRLAARTDELHDLASAITDSDKAEHWCELDLFAAFSPEDTVIPDGEPAETKWQKVPRWLSVLFSSILVFVPILITWFGLMKATDAYGEVLKASGPEAARRPFLEMWQQGFDGRLPEFFKFDNIAFCTLTAIGVLIFWTIFENVMRNSAERKEDTSEHDLAVLRARLRRALTRASLLLGQVRLSSPTRFGAELTKTVIEINLAGETARKTQTEMVDALARTWKATQQTTETLTSSAIDVREAIATLGRHLERVDIAHGDMTAAVRHASEMIDTVGSTTGQAVTRVGDQLSATISQTALDMRREFNEELTRSMTSLQDTVSTLDTRIGELAGATTDIGHAVAGANALIESVGSATEKSVRSTVSTLDTRISELTGTTASIGRAVDRATDSIHAVGSSTEKALQDTVSTLDTRIGRLVDTTAGIGNAVDRATVSISSVGASTEKAVGLIGGQVTDSLNVTAAEFRQAFGDASTEIREALGDWSDTAAAHASRIELVSDAAGRTVALLEQTRDTFDRLPSSIAGVLADLPAKVKELSDDEFAKLKDAIDELRTSVDRAADVFGTSAPGNGSDNRQRALW
ncbi:hypothetical protein [Streptosporangium sp. NPDC087985]|uniref:hypothetical protein n=1 Tax=Streptosporangium sp. NPDC087985 TaxID=3366196 RepID=UPI00380024A6